jgi:hypothetical protein
MITNTKKWNDREITISFVADGPDGITVAPDGYFIVNCHIERLPRQYRHTNPSRYARHRKKGFRR